MENLTTYWVEATSEAIPVVLVPVTTESAETTPTTMELPPSGRVIPLKEAGVADILVRLHGELGGYVAILSMEVIAAAIDQISRV